MRLEQAGSEQAVSLVVTLALSVAIPFFGAIFTGLLLVGFGKLFRTAVDDEDRFQDKTAFVVPDDYAYE